MQAEITFLIIIYSFKNGQFYLSWTIWMYYMRDLYMCNFWPGKVMEINAYRQPIKYFGIIFIYEF